MESTRDNEGSIENAVQVTSKLCVGENKHDSDSDTYIGI
jgi:hypothetical protein